MVNVVRAEDPGVENWPDLTRGVYFDPPYSGSARRSVLYSKNRFDIIQCSAYLIIEKCVTA